MVPYIFILSATELLRVEAQICPKVKQLLSNSEAENRNLLSNSSLNPKMQLLIKKMCASRREWPVTFFRKLSPVTRIVGFFDPLSIRRADVFFTNRSFSQDV